MAQPAGSVSDAAANGTSSGGVEREGYLNKKGNVNKSFQKRYFVLANNELRYFKAKPSSPAEAEQGKITLDQCTVEICTESKHKKQFCFELISPLQNRTYVLEADNGTNLQAWMDAIRRAMLRLRREKSKSISAQRPGRTDSATEADPETRRASEIAAQYAKPKAANEEQDKYDVYRQWLDESKNGQGKAKNSVLSRQLLNESQNKPGCCSGCVIL